MWDHLFTTVNDVGVKTVYKKTALGTIDMSRVGAEWGVCAGMSAIWLKNMFIGRDVLSAPNKGAAGILYAKWANRQDNGGPWKTTSSAEFAGVKSQIEAYSNSAGYNPSWLILKVRDGG